MAVVKKDFRGLRCPVPALRLNTLLANNEFAAGDLLELAGDCPTFEQDIRQVCIQWRKVVLKFLAEGQLKTATIKI